MDHTLTELARDILGADTMGAINHAFARMAVAEDEIARAKRRWPRAAKRLHGAFGTLCPTRYVLGTEEMFRKHCQELLARVKSGEDVVPGTDVELACAFMHASLAAPPDSDHAFAYGLVFARLFPERADITRDLGRESYKGRAEEILSELRRKIGNEVQRKPVRVL
jgi:hypothetical protein